MTEGAKTCPCCGEEIPLGLFARDAKVILPAAVALMNDAGHPIEHCFGDQIILASSRWFVRCMATLPLDWDESPVRAWAWAEVDQVVAVRLGHLMAGEASGLEASGVLACDVPGFPGTIGSRVALRHDESQGALRIRRTTDRRLQYLRSHDGHDGLVALYRRVWGGSGDVVCADLPLRAACAEAWCEALARPYFRRAVEPPPVLAGIRPAELLIAPPLDVGMPLAAITLGNAEANPRRAVEVMVRAKDPSDDFLDSFSEFCYFSRATSASLRAGQVVREHKEFISGTNGMDSWLLGGPAASADFEGLSVDLLTATPLHGPEATYAEKRGADALLDAMEEGCVDLTNLTRSLAAL